MVRNDILVRLKLAGEEFSREFERKFDEATRNADAKSETAGGRAGKGFSKGFLGAAGIASLGTAIGVAITESAQLGAEIASTSRQFNIGAEDLQVWRFAAQSAGVTASEFDGALGDLTRRIGEANAGNRDAQQGFVDLGLGFETTAGKARTTDAVLLDLADRIAAIEDPSERVRLGTQLLGEDFTTLYPLLLDGANGFSAAAAELENFGGVLSQEEIQNLQETNAKIEQMKSVLSIKVAGIVAENADAIVNLTTRLTEMAGAALNAADAWLTFRDAQLEYEAAKRSLPDDLSPGERASALDEIDTRLGRRETVTGSYLGGLFQTKEVVYQPNPGFSQSGIGRLVGRQNGNQDAVAAPRLSLAPRRGGGSPARRAVSSATDRAATEAAREAERAAREAIRNEEQLTELIERTIRAQKDSAEVERVRAEQGDVAAASAEAQLSFLRQNPLLVYDQVDALAAALGITEDLTAADRERLQLLIDQGDAAEQGARDAAEAGAQERIDREAAREEEAAKRTAERQAEAFRRAHEAAVLDVADLYETAMRGGVGDLWDYFEDEGTRVIAEIAAQWTLAMLSGQPFNLDSAASSAFGGSPISSIFFGSGGGAANDNGFGGIFGGSGGGVAGSVIKGGGKAGGPVASGGPLTSILGGGGIASAVPSIGLAFGAAQLSNVVGGGVADLLGLDYDKTAGGLLGGIAGIFGGLLGSTKRGSAIIGGSGGELDVTGFYGNSSDRKDAAAGSAGGIIDAIYQIADQLGGGVDASRGSVSIGVRGDSINVDPQGRGYTKDSKFADIQAFGSDEAAAIEFAIRDLISDGVLTGLSQATQNLLSAPGTDLEAQIEKALLIEQVPKLLKRRLDPLGAALDDLYDKFKILADAMREGGASAEQVADAQRLYELEKADAIASIGAASQTLKDFLDSLNAGNNSPLSLREQRAEADAQLAPFLTQIAEAEAANAEVERLRAAGGDAAAIEQAEIAARTAAAAIDQSGFTEASQLLLSISRQSNASSGAFFSDFDRIRDLTGQAIGFVEGAAATTGDSRDPFSSAIAQNTADAAYILSEHTVVLRAINDNLALISQGSGGGGFVRESREYIR